MRCVITGGGTGGHLAIARALQEALITRGHEALFIGSTSGQDRMWFEEHSGFSHAYFLATTGVVNRKGWGRVAALWRIFKAFLQARRILKRHEADAVISVGGFSAAPASLAALSRGVPLFIHEQNAVSGRLNRLLKPFAKRFFSSYDAASPIRDYPVSGELFERARLRHSVETVIFLGGSQGAAFINDLALSAAPRLRERGIAIIHQCGERDYERVKGAYAELGIEAELYGFTKELPALLERSDLAVSRAGASTLWELCASGIPALYIPYPHAAADHQYHNARFLVEQGLAWCERQGEGVEGLFLSLLDEPLEERSRALMELCRPEGAEHMIQIIEETH
jgi:UDP-N-acetylglucosamine--N-acetylmuramyl-(pentapeptide) pyrophosphoryl-undecaprenol N-acetylglucosamine transferase